MSQQQQPLSLDVPGTVSIGERRNQQWARGWCVLSLCLGLIGTGATCWQLDALAASSLIPAWCWLIAGVASLILARRLRPRRWLVVMILLWLLFVVACVEEYRSLSRSVWSRFIRPRAVEASEFRLRVVSLNCADGSLRTAREATAMAPDILLFQESPGRDALEQLAVEMFGNSDGVLWSSDTSIITRWPIRAADTSDHFVEGLVQLPSGFQIRVVSLRLAPPVVRYDLWNPACWREQAAKRRQHTKQIDQLLDALIDDIEDAEIIGGDFNAAQHDRATWPLREFAQDTFDVAGRAWGNTVLNTIPVLRFDQIWASRHFHPIATWAVRSEHSDHRLVVSDLVVPGNWRKRGRASPP